MDLVLVSRRGLIAIVFDAPGSIENRIPGGVEMHTALCQVRTLETGGRRSARDEQKLVRWSQEKLNGKISLSFRVSSLFHPYHFWLYPFRCLRLSFRIPENQWCNSDISFRRPKFFQEFFIHHGVLGASYPAAADIYRLRRQHHCLRCHSAIIYRGWCVLISKYYYKHRRAIEHITPIHFKE